MHEAGTSGGGLSPTPSVNTDDVDNSGEDAGRGKEVPKGTVEDDDV